VKKSAWIFMDCVPYGGNVTMHSSSPGHYWMAVDHHYHPKEIKDDLGCSIIEPHVGANATIMARILLDMEITLSPRLASTLSYAIISDTQDFSRDASKVDLDTYSDLFPLSNQKIISRLRNTPRPRQYFNRVYHSLRNTYYYRNIVWAYIGVVESPEIVAEFADFILSAERITWSLAIGKWKDKLYLSLRSSQLNAKCDEVIKKLVPEDVGTVGGHDQFAGGLVYFESDILSQAINTIFELFARVTLRVPRTEPVPAGTPLVGAKSKIEENFPIPFG
jgi:nanoRNase/pAp phosphatase (c-di-AMP/oligoRNAs hydrolase)